MLFLNAAAFGSGFGLFEQGAKATAMGGAFVATADDPSAIFYNVAGIAQQRRATVMAGATFINFSNEFTGDPNDPLAQDFDLASNNCTNDRSAPASVAAAHLTERTMVA